MKRLAVLLMLCLVAFTSLKAQEVCNNGRDDDGDGFIDCYDRDCSVSTFCKDFYLGEDAQCEVTPPAFPQFTMALDFASPNETTNHLSRMAVGDLNRDGKPEIITMNRYTDRLFILNGADGSIQQQATVDFEPQWEIAIANIDNDNCGEIFFYGVEDPPGDNNSTFHFYAYDCSLNLIWRSEPLRGEPVNYGLADFDGDGKVELYVKDAIYDAHTGTRIVKSTASSWTKTNGGPVAVDMEGDDKLELVVGCAIYSVDLGNRTLDDGSLTLLKKRNDYFIRNEFNATSVADFNQDGSLDVLASGSTNAHGENTTVFFWDVKNDTIATYSDPIPGDFTIYACPTATGEFYKDGWKNGTGRINIADLDGDGKLNISYVSGKFLYALNERLEPMSWSPKTVNEETSGYTGCTLFDFNGDGKSEIVYRDERFLYIINGTNGTVYNQQACVSRTNREYPIVADVDADGSTELCVTCGFDDDDAITNFCNTEYSRYSHVRVFRSANDPWVPARRVWNQHGYFNVNVNDDLTIPIKQQKHHLVFSTGNCTVGPNRPLNGFLNQAPFLNIDGCPTYKSPDLAFVNNSLSVNPPTCPNQNFTISFQVQNTGDMSLSGSVPITFYNGNPLAAGAIKLNTIMVPLNLGVDAIHTITNATVNGPGGPFTLYIVLNDAGTKVPPIALPNTDFLECDYSDNVISTPVNPLPVAITALKVQDNIKCTGSTSPDNGAVRAFIPIAGGGENTTAYNFYWSDGAVAKPIPADHTGASVNGLAEGTYTVFAIHKTANCSSASAAVTVGRVDRNVQAKIVLENPYDNCKNPNAKLRAVVNDTDNDGVGEPVGLFTFAWYEGQGTITDPQISVSHIATSLKPKTYTVIVTEKATGCRTIASYDVIDNSIKPVVTASAVSITCASGNTGSASATVNNAVAGYKFDWYNGSNVKPAPDFTGDNYTNLGGGSYTVVATHNSSQCESTPVTVTVNQSAPITVSVTGSTSQTSCDPAQPNGTASANVSGNTLGYSFEWFKGQNTLQANRISTSANATGLPAGIYTIKATHLATGCSDTDQVTIANAVVTPTLIMGAVANQTNCTTPNGRVTVNVSLDSPTDYTFSWFNGTTPDATPDYPDTDNVLDGLAAGTYTVKAVHKTKHCTTAPVTATVTNVAPLTTIVQNSVPKLPTDCNANDGELEVRVSASGNTLGFMIEWFRNADTAPFATETGITISKQVQLTSALYSIRATNLNTGCTVTEAFELPFASAQSLTLVSVNPATTCSPKNEGNLTVQLEPTDAVIPGPPPISFSVDDYVVNFYAGRGASGTLLESRAGSAGTLNGDGTANYALSGLTPGFYTIVAVENNSLLGDCPSVPLIIEIKHDITYPVIATTLVDANMNCTGTTGSGRIELNIDGIAPESDYDYTWHEGADTSSPLLGAGTGGSTANGGAVALGLPAGLFTVEVTNRATQCPSVATIQILNNPPVISIPTASIAITDVTFCDLMNGGAASVSNISEGSGSVPVTDYTFAWYDASQSILPNAGAPNTTASINGLTAGTYYVMATKNAGTAGLNCASATVAFEIADKTQGTVNIALTGFTKPTRCLKPANVQGQLVVNAYGGAAGTTYSYNWYASTSASGPVQFAGPAFTGISIPAGQTSITYTVEAINNLNHCTIRETYTLPLEVAPVNITASAAPVTFCSADDGAVFATVTSGNSFDYTYSWDSGNAVTVPGDYTGKGVNNLAVGDYTVIAVDNSDSFCQSPVVTVTIDDGRIYPVVSATALAPLTLCDPARPDGVARATVNGDIVNYSFDWYLGNPPAGAPLFSGAEAGNLAATTYTVVATHIVTACSSTATVAIDKATVPIPIPQVELISNVTSCAADNGALAASVNGNTGDFIFHWYTTDPGTPADTTSARYHGEIYSNLSEGKYYVSATSRLTGCISGPANGDIIEAPVYPDFDFRATAATCGQENGFLAIYMLNDTDIASVVWSGNGTTVSEPSIQDIPAGYYSVTVTSILGCATTKDIEVKTEIRPFNGVSRNIDSKNDIFLINCIDEFPDNLVKIFNRAGTLVYEANGYDNIETYFDGKSNKGLSLMGNNLPDGTYFYIIDKRDGSKPMAGYLEVVN